MNFFVAGLPRSRTAWLANFLSYDGHFCFHEGINGCHSMNEYKEKLNGNGDSCTGLMLLDIERHFPNAPKVIIESDPQTSIDFMKDVYGMDDPQYIYDLQDKLNKLSGLRIHFDEINENLEVIWNHLIGTPYHFKRGEMLVKLDIQVRDPHDFDQSAAEELLCQPSISYH